MSAAPPALTVSANGGTNISDQLLNTYVQGGALLANLRDFPGLSNMTVWMVGTAEPGDGGQGIFCWDSASTEADDGGTTCIAPNGILVGRWLRQISSTPYLPARTSISADTTWYVDGTYGSDSNAGTGPGTSAWQTIQHAINVLADLYDGRGLAGTISVASGTYNVGTGLIASQPWTGFSTVTLSCSTTPSSVVLQSTGNCVSVTNFAVLYIHGGFELDTSVAGKVDLECIWGGECFLSGNVTFGSVTGGTQMYATRFGYIEIDGNTYINGGTSAYMMEASHQGNIRVTGGAVVTFNGNSSYTGATLYALYGDITITDGASITSGGHTISGQSYQADQGSMILWASGTSTSIPGSNQGSEILTGRYVRGATNVSNYSGSFACNMASAGGSTSVITGVGFTPGSVTMFASVAGGSSQYASSGMATVTYSGTGPLIGDNHCVSGGGTGQQPTANYCVAWYVDGTDYVFGAVTAVGTDGFTVTWTKGGTPTGTLTVLFNATRGL